MSDPPIDTLLVGCFYLSGKPISFVKALRPSACLSLSLFVLSQSKLLLCGRGGECPILLRVWRGTFLVVGLFHFFDPSFSGVRKGGSGYGGQFFGRHSEVRFVVSALFSIVPDFQCKIGTRK